LIRAAKNHVVDPVRRDLRLRDERRDHLPGEIIGAHAAEPAAIPAERRANTVDNVRGAGHRSRP
jgi:hypothetical protein